VKTELPGVFAQTQINRPCRVMNVEFDDDAPAWVTHSLGEYGTQR
jgi:hypothetical protein